MGNKQQLSGKDQVLNPESFLRHLNINGDQSFDTKADSQNTTRVNTTGHNDTNSTYNQQPGLILSSPKSKRKRKQVTLSKNPNQRDKQIFNAKKDYQKKKIQNQSKLAEIRQKIQTYNKIYRDDEQSQENPYSQQKQEEVIIWGKKVKMSKGNPMQQYYQYRYPKQPITIGEQDDEYANWQIYKNQMSKAKFKQLQQEQRQLLDEEQYLKQRYENLVRQRNQLKNQSRFLPKNNVDPEISKPLQKLTLQNEPNQDKQVIITPSFKHAQKIPYVQQTPLNKKRKSQPKTASTQEKVSIFFTEQPINVIDDWVHPQNIINSDPQYYAKQMHYYENYLKKKRSNYVPVKFIEFQQQYPAKRQVYTKPIRTKQTIIDPYLQKIQRRKRRKNAKSRSKSRSNSKVFDESIYTKVYEKIPRKKSYKSPEQRFKAARNFYPYEDSPPKSSKSTVSNYPLHIQVNDSINKRNDDEGTLYFHYISREDQKDKDWMNKKNYNYQIPNGDNDQNDEKAQTRRRISYQRQMQWQILQKVRIKNL